MELIASDQEFVKKMTLLARRDNISLVPTLGVGTGLPPLRGVGQYTGDDVYRISGQASVPFRPRRGASQTAFPRRTLLPPLAAINAP